MNKNILVFTVILIGMIVIGLTSCNQKPIVDGAYDFIIYESDSDNSNLSDNVVVAKYHIEYVDCQTVTDTLIQKDNNRYYFSEDANDYLVLSDSGYGLTYVNGYFAGYSECANNTEIDVSWSYTAVNGGSSTCGIGETPLDGLTEYGFVINGWKTN